METAATARPLRLAQFMRENVNVPFSFAMIEATHNNRQRRMHKAASVLKDAARHLAHWTDPPVVSPEGREVFFAYAQNLELHVARLETAADERDPETASESLEHIRQTCNDCHRYFRPASRISRDVVYDRLAIELEVPQ